MAELLKDLIENNPDTYELQLQQANSRDLSKILEYMEYHIDNPESDIDRPIQTNNFKSLVTEWDYNFVNSNNDIMFDILITANYLGVNNLINIISCKAATLIKNKSPDEIRKHFNLINDFTNEEKQQIQQDYPLL